MTFTPLIIMNLILLAITILLAIADRLLVTYGECKITVSKEEEEKEITVQGGNTLLERWRAAAPDRGDIHEPGGKAE
jgi:Na+-transporting NADH:ubiquinone oxidoreductase subunit NqrF